MIAAGRAAECGRRVLLVEANRQLGEKLNRTGGGRCNITNAEFDTRTLLAFFGDAAKFLFAPFSRVGVQDVFDFFEGRGLPLVIEAHKRAFPKSQRATDVTRVLRAYMQEHGVSIRTGIEVKRLHLHDGRIIGVDTSQGAFTADAIILATGGASYRETGSSDDGMDWLRETGHTVQAATPDLVPLRVSEPWVKALSGTSVDPVKITFSATNGESIARTGKILFTHFGLSGPLILNSAHDVKRLLKQGQVEATIDLFPHLEAHPLDQRVLACFNENGNKLVRNTAKWLAPPGLGAALVAHLVPELLDKKVNTVTQPERKHMVQWLKALPLTVTGTMGYDWAIVCDGGIPLTEVDTRTMASRIHPNLYITGDLLHISRPSGGYSLQLCWTTGLIAGQNA